MDKPLALHTAFSSIQAADDASALGLLEEAVGELLGKGLIVEVEGGLSATPLAWTALDEALAEAGGAKHLLSHAANDDDGDYQYAIRLLIPHTLERSPGEPAPYRYTGTALQLKRESRLSELRDNLFASGTVFILILVVVALSPLIVVGAILVAIYVMAAFPVRLIRDALSRRGRSR